MTRQLATILVLVAMLPQLVLGVGSGRVLELCFCGPTVVTAHVKAGERHSCCDHADHHRDHSDNSTDLPAGCADLSDPAELPACPGFHLKVGGHYGRHEPSQTGDFGLVFRVLAMSPLEAPSVAPPPCPVIQQSDDYANAASLRVVRTTRLLI